MSRAEIIISYLTLRRLIGIMAIAHPIMLVLGGVFIFDTGLQASMSDYYWTGMRDVFVGVVVAIGIFILSYKGYSKQDEIAAFVAGFAAITVALFPIPPPGVQELTAQQKYVGLIHGVAAITYLLASAYFCLILFVKYNSNKPISFKKYIRNLYYRLSGVIVLAVVFSILIYLLVPAVNDYLSGISFVFWMEVIAFWSFGFAWLIKGRTLLTDS